VNYRWMSSTICPSSLTANASFNLRGRLGIEYETQVIVTFNRTERNGSKLARKSCSEVRPLK